MKNRIAIAAVLIAALLVLALGWLPESSGAQVEVKNCAICHGKQAYKRLLLPSGETVDMFVDVKNLGESVHHNRTCTDCHADIETLPHEGYKPKPVNCTRCHYLGNPVGAPQSETYQAYAESVHGKALAEGKPNAPRCQDCHGTHDVKPIASAESRVSHGLLSETCGRCHEKERNDYIASVHGTPRQGDHAEGDTPTCTSCHGEHNIFSSNDPRSTISPQRVEEDCAQCHEALEIVGKYGISTEQIETYKKSFHGLAVRFGSTVAANCASCHGHHLVLPEDDPRSTVNKDNIPKTCGQEGCHEGAGTNFAIGKIHVNPEDAEAGLVYYISTFFRYFTITVIAGLLIHIALDLMRRYFGSRKRGKGTEQVRKEEAG